MAAPAAASPSGLPAFEAHLAAHDSATEALQQWCRIHRIGSGPIRAQRIEHATDDPPAGTRDLLGAKPAESLALRKVRLTCDGAVLSVAWNWYLPARLTPAMNALLEQTDQPFGRVAAPLRFRRETIEVTRGPAENCPADTISTHRALLRLPDGSPLAYLVECYTRENLAR